MLDVARHECQVSPRLIRTEQGLECEGLPAKDQPKRKAFGNDERLGPDPGLPNGVPVLNEQMRARTHTHTPILQINMHPPKHPCPKEAVLWAHPERFLDLALGKLFWAGPDVSP